MSRLHLQPLAPPPQSPTVTISSATKTRDTSEEDEPPDKCSAKMTRRTTKVEPKTRRPNRGVRVIPTDSPACYKNLPYNLR